MNRLNRSLLKLTTGLGLLLVLAPMSNAAPQPQIRKQTFRVHGGEKGRGSLHADQRQRC